MNPHIICSILIILLFPLTIFAHDKDGVYIASAAGYKEPVNEIIELYNQNHPLKILPVYGNMQVITTYIKKSNRVSLIIGDKRFINKSGITLQNSIKLGNGKLILVYQDEFKITSIQELTDPKIARIGIPDPKKTIYGRAGVELLKALNLYDIIKDKFIILKTVPQVSLYLLSGSIDVGLINVTDYIKIKNDTLKSLDTDSKLYTPIEIEAGLVDSSAQDFFEYLQSPPTQAIFSKYGL